jgi:hypothetical protein
VCTRWDVLEFLLWIAGKGLCWPGGLDQLPPHSFSRSRLVWPGPVFAYLTTVGGALRIPSPSLHPVYGMKRAPRYAKWRGGGRAVCEVAGSGVGRCAKRRAGGRAVCEEVGRGSGGVRSGGAGSGGVRRPGIRRRGRPRGTHGAAVHTATPPRTAGGRRPHRHADHNDQRVPSPNATPTRTAGGCRPPTPRRPERPEGAVRHATPTKKAGGRRPQTTPSDHPQFLSGADPPCRHRNRPRRRPPRRDAGPPVRGRPRRRR